PQRIRATRISRFDPFREIRWSVFAYGTDVAVGCCVGSRYVGQYKSPRDLRHLPPERHADFTASLPQAASISWPRLRRTVTVTSSATSTRMKALRRSSGVRSKGRPSTGLYMMRFTLLGTHRETAANLRASASEPFRPSNTQYSYVMGRPVLW